MSALITVNLRLGKSKEWEAACDELSVISKSRYELVHRFLNSGIDLVHIDRNSRQTPGTNDMWVVLEPSISFLNFLSAARAGEGEKFLVESGFHGNPS